MSKEKNCPVSLISYNGNIEFFQIKFPNSYYTTHSFEIPEKWKRSIIEYESQSDSLACFLSNIMVPNKMMSAEDIIQHFEDNLLFDTNFESENRYEHTIVLVYNKIHKLSIWPVSNDEFRMMYTQIATTIEKENNTMEENPRFSFQFSLDKGSFVHMYAPPNTHTFGIPRRCFEEIISLSETDTNTPLYHFLSIFISDLKTADIPSGINRYFNENSKIFTNELNGVKEYGFIYKRVHKVTFVIDSDVSVKYSLVTDTGYGNYPKNGFCKSICCPHLTKKKWPKLEPSREDIYEESCAIDDNTLCLFTAKELHRWFKINDYEIIKKSK